MLNLKDRKSGWSSGFVGEKLLNQMLVVCPISQDKILLLGGILVHELLYCSNFYGLRQRSIYPFDVLTFDVNSQEFTLENRMNSINFQRTSGPAQIGNGTVVALVHTNDKETLMVKYEGKTGNFSNIPIDTETQ